MTHSISSVFESAIKKNVLPFRSELRVFELHEEQTEDTAEDLRESGVCVCVPVCVRLSISPSVLLIMTSIRAGLVMCHALSQGVVVSDEELRRTFLQPEEAGPQQQGEELVDGFRQPNLFGKLSMFTLAPSTGHSFTRL